MCRELRHENIIALEEVMLEDKAIFMVLEYAEHDFLVNQKIFKKRGINMSFVATYSPSFAFAKETYT